MLLHACEQACLFMPLIFALHLSYRILKICDLTTEGSFLLGACLFSLSIYKELGILPSLGCAILGGVFAGMIASSLQRFFGFSDLISGILSTFLLHSICLQAMGRPNMSLYDKPTLLAFVSENLNEPYARLLVAAGVALLVFCILHAILSSRLGLTLRAFGNNPRLLSFFGKSEKTYCFIGLIISNMFAALGGALTAELQGFADISMGTGVVLIALAAVIMGERFCSAQSIALQLLSSFAGILFYFLAMHGLIKVGVDPINLRMATALLTIGVLAMQRKEFGVIR